MTSSVNCRSRLDSGRSVSGGSATATSWPNPSPRGSDDELDCGMEELWQEEMLSQPPSPLSPKMSAAMSARPSFVPPINLDKAMTLQAMRANQARQKAQSTNSNHDAAAMSWTYLDLLSWASSSQQAPKAQAKVVRAASTGAAVGSVAPQEVKKWRTCEGSLCDEEEVTISNGPDSEIKVDQAAETSEYHPSFFGSTFTTTSWFG